MPRFRFIVDVSVTEEYEVVADNKAQAVMGVHEANGKMYPSRKYFE